MSLWLVPVIYAAASFLAGITLPRFEEAYLAYKSGISVASAQAFFAAVASGMIGLTGVVFTVGLVMVQFSAIAYSPRIVLLLARDPKLFHSLGVFVATFTYSLCTLLHVDRNGSGAVPLISGVVVAGLVLLSTLLFSAMMKGLLNLQITYVLHAIGDRGREVVRETFQRLDEKAKNQSKRRTGGVQCFRVGSSCPNVEVYRRAAHDCQVRYRPPGSPGTTGRGRHRDGMRGRRYPRRRIHCCYRFMGPKLCCPKATSCGPFTLGSNGRRSRIRNIPFGCWLTSPSRRCRRRSMIRLRQSRRSTRSRICCVAWEQRDLDAGYAHDAAGSLRLIFPMPTWEDYLVLSFDEIRHYGAGSVQVIRRLRSALVGLADSVTDDARMATVERYLKQLDLTVDRSILTADDQETARQEDRQGLGLSRKQSKAEKIPLSRR